uniref:Putative cell wall protein iff6 n=1 Tax=Anopheles marajoara TaxID=58244 RepID=A0A2M4BFE5_9DIPT
MMADIMKIHSYSTSRPQEKVITRSATTSQPQEVNGTPESKKKQQQDSVPITIRTSARQQQRKESKAAAAAAAAAASSSSVSTVSPSSSTPARSSTQESKNIASVKRSTAVEAGSGAAKRSRRQQQSEERETEANRQVKREPSVDSQDSVAAESPDQKKQPTTPPKQRAGGASVSSTPLSQGGSTPSKEGQSTEALASPAASSSTETAPETKGRRAAVTNGLDIEDELAYFHLPKGSHAIVKQGNIVISTSKRQEVDSEDDDGGTSSSTASAVEDICDMDSTHSSSRHSHAGTPINRTIRNVKLAKIGTETVVDDSTTTILMSEEDYHQHQLQQQQHQQRQDEEQSLIEEYDTGVLVTEDMEDTDGGGGASGGLLSGNRLYRKKVKRKLIGRQQSLAGSSTAAAHVGNVSGIGSISSTKAKLQMVHEFPTLFLGLRRNRMFLINSLAQGFDLNQRDIILTLRKIKLNESSARLAVIFGLGVNEVDLLVHKNVPKIADCLRNFILWPDDFTMKLNVPIKLRQHFSRIHLILNYLVLRVNQNVVRSLSQLANIDSAASYCPTEQCHKLKFLIASTLDGCVCFISRAFGIQTDDEQVLSQSGFLTKFKTNTNLIAGQNFHHFEDRLANGHDHANNNGGRNHDDDDDEHGATEVEPFEDIVSEKISKSRTFKLKNYIENILENFQNHQILHPQTCIDCRTFPLLDDIVVIVGALINLQKQEID